MGDRRAMRSSGSATPVGLAATPPLVTTAVTPSPSRPVTVRATPPSPRATRSPAVEGVDRTGQRRRRSSSPCSRRRGRPRRGGRRLRGARIDAVVAERRACAPSGRGGRPGPDRAAEPRPAASRTRWMRSRLVSRARGPGPHGRRRRPASSTARRTSGGSEAGPMVATILVRRPSMPQRYVAAAPTRTVGAVGVAGVSDGGRAAAATAAWSASWTATFVGAVRAHDQHVHATGLDRRRDRRAEVRPRARRRDAVGRGAARRGRRRGACRRAARTRSARARGGLRQEREDPAAVVVDHHDRRGRRPGRPSPSRPLRVVQEGDVADQQRGAGDRRPPSGDADRGGHDAVDAVGAPVGEDPHAAAGRAEPLDVADGHRRRHHQRGVVGQRARQRRGRRRARWSRRGRRAPRRWPASRRRRPLPTQARARRRPASAASRLGGQPRGQDASGRPAGRRRRCGRDRSTRRGPRRPPDRRRCRPASSPSTFEAGGRRGGARPRAGGRRRAGRCAATASARGHDAPGARAGTPERGSASTGQPERRGEAGGLGAVAAPGAGDEHAAVGRRGARPTEVGPAGRARGRRPAGAVPRRAVGAGPRRQLAGGAQQRLAEGEVEVDRAGPAGTGGASATDRAASERHGRWPPRRRRPGSWNQRTDRPKRWVWSMVWGAPTSCSSGGRSAVTDEQRHAGQVGFDDRGVQLGRRGAARGEQDRRADRWPARCPGPGRPAARSSWWTWTSMSGWPARATRQRRRARAGRDHGVGDAVRGPTRRPGSRRRWPGRPRGEPASVGHPSTRRPSRAHLRGSGDGPVRRAPRRRASARPRPRVHADGSIVGGAGAGARRRPRGGGARRTRPRGLGERARPTSPRGRSCSSRPPAGRRRSWATPWALASRCTPRSPTPGGARARHDRRAPPASRTPASGRPASSRTPPPLGDSDDEGIDRFLEAWLAQPLFAGLSARRAQIEDRRRNTVAGLVSSLELAGTGTQAAAVGPPPRADHPGAGGGRRRRREVLGAGRADGPRRRPVGDARARDRRRAHRPPRAAHGVPPPAPGMVGHPRPLTPGLRPGAVSPRARCPARGGSP